MSKTRSVPVHQVAIIQARVDAMNVIAARLGMPALTLVKGEPVAKVISFMPGNGNESFERYLWTQSVEVVGSCPRINGYRVLCVIEHTEHGNLLYTLPGCTDSMIEYAHVGPNCVHCGIKRTRKQTYLLEDSNHNIKQVGSTCLEDFTRSTDTAALFRFVEALGSMDDDFSEFGDGFFGMGMPATDPVEWVAASIASIRFRGYIKADDIQGRASTRQDVSFLVGSPPSDSKRKEAWKAGQPNQADREAAQVMLAWVLESSASSDYMNNLKVAARHRCVERNVEGVLASLPIAYQKHLDENAAQVANPGHYGAVKDKVVTRCQVIRASGFQNDFGCGKVVTMRSHTGHIFVTYTTSKEILDTTDFGGEWFVYGTVKKHGASKSGAPETVLTRITLRRDYVKAKGYTEL